MYFLKGNVIIGMPRDFDHRGDSQLWIEEHISGEHDISLQYDLSQRAQEPRAFYKAAWHLSLGHFLLRGHTKDNHKPRKRANAKYFRPYKCENT